MDFSSSLLRQLRQAIGERRQVLRKTVAMHGDAKAPVAYPMAMQTVMGSANDHSYEELFAYDQNGG